MSLKLVCPDTIHIMLCNTVHNMTCTVLQEYYILYPTWIISRRERGAIELNLIVRYSASMKAYYGSIMALLWLYYALLRLY